MINEVSQINGERAGLFNKWSWKSGYFKIKINLHTDFILYIKIPHRLKIKSKQ